MLGLGDRGTDRKIGSPARSSAAPVEGSRRNGREERIAALEDEVARLKKELAALEEAEEELCELVFQDMFDLL